GSRSRSSRRRRASPPPSARASGPAGSRRRRRRSRPRSARRRSAARGRSWAPSRRSAGPCSSSPAPRTRRTARTRPRWPRGCRTRASRSCPTPGTRPISKTPPRSAPRSRLSSTAPRRPRPDPSEDVMPFPWTPIRTYEDIRYERFEAIAKVTIARPEVRNAFRPKTLHELSDAFARAREDRDIGVVVLTGEGPEAFCSGGDQRVRGDRGYVGDDGVPRLNVLDLQKQIRSLPKPVVAMVAGYAIGGGHVLHVVC